MTHHEETAMADETDIPEEPDDAGDHEVPVDLVELHEVLEWAAAVSEEDVPR